MKLIRYQSGDAVAFGEIEGDEVYPLEGAIPALGRIAGRAPLPLAKLSIKTPVTPTKIICIGPGYKGILGSRPVPQRPFLWLKPLTSLRGPGDPIVIPTGLDAPVNYEPEIAIVIGKQASCISPAESADYIFGYTCVNDVTPGDIAGGGFRESDWFVDGKIFDSFCPIGPMVVTDIDPANLEVSVRVNGEVRGKHRVGDRLWAYPDLIAHISRVMTLMPGDVICTGSVPWPAPISPGELIEVEVEGIGRLANPVVAGPVWQTPLMNPGGSLAGSA